MTTIPDPAIASACGLAVFPLPPGAKRAVEGWHERIRTDLDDWPAGANVGIACRASGVVGLDLDVKAGVDGLVAFAALCDAAGVGWPATLTVATAHAGRHLYFAAPAGVEIPSSIGRVAAGIDVRAPGRARGGYLVGPDSVVDGRRYTITSDQPIALLPDWLASRIIATARPFWPLPHPEPEGARR